MYMKAKELIYDIQLTSSPIIFEPVAMDSWSPDELYAVLGVPLIEEVGPDYRSSSTGLTGHTTPTYPQSC